MLCVKNLNFDYAEQPLLHQINFTLNPGELMHLQGQNGIGKSTLLKLLAGLLTPQRGNILFQHYSSVKDRLAYQAELCFVGHKAGVTQLLTVAEHCQHDLFQKISKDEVKTLLAQYSLIEYHDVPCHLLSAGLLRRVSLLKLAVTSAKLWLLDEPLIALDKNAVKNLISLIQQHRQKGGQVILTSHQALPLKKQDYRVFSL